MIYIPTIWLYHVAYDMVIEILYINQYDYLSGLFGPINAPRLSLIATADVSTLHILVCLVDLWPSQVALRRFSTKQGLIALSIAGSLEQICLNFLPL